jgi:hypothetical protein
VEPLAIISFHLQGMNYAPSLLTYHHLQPWLQGNVVHVECDFNFNDVNDDFEVRLNDMLKRFEDGDLKQYDII